MNLECYTVHQLKNKCRELGIKGSYKLRKPELLNVLSKSKTKKRICKPKSIKDQFGIDIFNTFIKKYQKDSPFQRSKAAVSRNFENKSITQKGKTFLIDSVIEPYEEMFLKFVKQVQDTRTFKEKASSTSKLRNIVTPQDWAEAIIEIEDLIAKFKVTFFDQVKVMMDSNTISKQCANTLISECNRPCNINKFKKQCSYKK